MEKNYQYFCIVCYNKNCFVKILNFAERLFLDRKIVYI